MTVRTCKTPRNATLVSQALPAAHLAGGVDVPLASCTDRVSAVRPGDVFVASDDAVDSGQAAQEAVARGAVAVVCERFLPLFGTSQYVVQDAQAAYSRLCHTLLGHPTRQLNAIGIAGSHGKTSIAMVLDSIFKVAGRSAATAANQFTRIDGRSVSLMKPTTAAGIADFADEALACGCRHAVVELSEETLRTKAAHAADFDVVCLANLHGQGGDSDRSLHERRQAMSSALELLTPEGMAILNADDADSMRILAEYDGPALTYGIHHPAEVTGMLVERHVNEQVFLLTVGDETASVRTKVVGDSHLTNCLAAAAIAKVYGISLQHIAAGIEQVTVVPGVMQRFDAGLGTSVFVDRGTSSVAKGAALEAAQSVATGKVLAVVDRECSVTAKLADRTIATRGLANEDVISEAVARVLAAMEVRCPRQLRTIADKLTGVALALAAADAGDVVVLCGLDSLMPRERRASVSLSEANLLKTLMYELAAAEKKAA